MMGLLVIQAEIAENFPGASPLDPANALCVASGDAQTFSIPEIVSNGIQPHLLHLKPLSREFSETNIEPLFRVN